MDKRLLQRISSPFSSHCVHPSPSSLMLALHAVDSLQGLLKKDGDDFVPVKGGRSCPFQMPFKCEDSTQAKQCSTELIGEVITAYLWEEG